MTDDSPRKYRTSRLDDHVFDNSLVGSYFHSDAERGWQGVVVAEPMPGIYLVELFSWFSGDSTSQHLLRLDDMIDTGWQFYDTSEWMDDIYQRSLGARWERERGETPAT